MELVDFILKMLIINLILSKLSKHDISIVVQPKEVKMKVYILNSSIIPNFGTYQYQETTFDVVEDMVWDENNYVISAIGHRSTAVVFSRLARKTTFANRISISMDEGDKAVVFKPKMRLQEGQVLTDDELESMEYELGILTRIS